MRHPLLASLLLIGVAAAPGANAAPPKKMSVGQSELALLKAVGDVRRKPENRARDKYRHPAETLAFFGVKPDQTVVEVAPGGGWYMEILAPLLRDKGRYFAAAGAPGKGRTALESFIASDPARFDKVTITTLAPTTASEIAPAGSADVVLTFRNVHNFLMAGDAVAAGAFTAFYTALKPGGILGVVEHRLPEARDAALEKKSGYVKTSTVVRLAKAAGFKLVAESPINANKKDTADWPKGVWTLPPNYANGETDKARYQAIGESDRMTLKFMKPAS